MRPSIETTGSVKLKGCIPHAFEKDVLHYQGSRRYVATWWSKDFQSLVCADGEVWRANEVDEDRWVWWTFILTLSNDFDINSLGFQPERPVHVLLLDLHEREVWHTPIGPAGDILTAQVLQGEGELNCTYIVQ